jgi:hypothetical protein
MSVIIFDGGLHEKDPADILVYAMDWGYYETIGEGVEIASAVFAITGYVFDDEEEEYVEEDPVALTKDNESSEEQMTFVRLAAGTVGVTYTVTVTIVTNESPSQTLERSFRVYVRQR